MSPRAPGDPDCVPVPQQPGLLPVGSLNPIFRRASWGGGRSQEQSGPRDHTGAAVRGCKRSAQFLPGTAGWCKPDGQDEEAELGKGDIAQAGMEMGQGGGNSEARASTGG